MISKELLKTIIAEGYPQRDIVHREVKMVDINKIYTIIGPRRAGKTYFLFQVINGLLGKGAKREQVLYINFEDDRLEHMETEDLQALISAFYELYPENRKRKAYFMFDEIQNAPSWSKFVRRLHEKENCEIYVTGSSAKLLSREIATELRGRTWVYEMFPFSFREFLNAKGVKLSPDSAYSKERFGLVKLFEEYLLNGGFPEACLQEQFVRCRLLQNYFDLVIFRDVVERYSLSSPDLVKDMFLYLANNFSRLFSVNKYYSMLKSQNRKASKDTLYALEGHIEDTMYYFFVPVYSASRKSQMVTPRKSYLVDNGLALCLSSRATPDLGWLYENLAFVELRRRGFQLFYFKGERECDFVAVDGKGSRLPVQVSIEPDKENELEGLLEAMEFLKVKEGLFLTRDTEKEINEEGKKIRFVPLWKWLLGQAYGQV